MKELKIGNLTINLPIIQGGMGVGISLSGLAAAVANEGGVGVISTAAIGVMEKDFISNFLEANIRALKKEIRKAREKTKGIIGVNIMVALSNYEDMVKTAIEEGIDIIFSGAGLPLNLPKFLKEKSKTKIVPIVSSARAASIVTKKWHEKYNYIPDAVVVEGPMAGGHLGFKKEQLNDENFYLEKLVPEIVNEMKPWEKLYKKIIPIIAAGGIYTGGDIKKFLKLGASGVQMATRFVTTHECDASIEFKNTYINSKKEDIIIIDSPVGMPGRAIKGSFTDGVKNGKKHPLSCYYHCIRTCDIKKSPYCIAKALINAQKGNMEDGFAFAGVNAYRANEILSVKDLIKKIVSEFQQDSLAQMER
jgi:NAD(P)H-dependent flavin oxidoreductase YrpB (nitropropane dioxygenase family)